MKKMYKILLFYFLTSILTYSQDCYMVQKVKGEIIIEKTGQAMKAGDQVCSNDNILFNDPNSAAIVHSTVSGRFVIKPNKETTPELQNIIKAAISAVISPSNSTLSYKYVIDPIKNNTNDLDGPVSVNYTINDLGVEFLSPYFVLGEYRLKLDKKNYSMDDSKYFQIEYKFNDNLIVKKLNYSNDTLILNKDIFNIDGLQTEKQNVTLYYINNEKKINIKTFDLIFAMEDDVYNEMNELFLRLKKEKKVNLDIEKTLTGEENKISIEIENELKWYLTDVYGNINEDNVKLWINRKFKN
jgi:hypothetical protein